MNCSNNVVFMKNIRSIYTKQLIIKFSAFPNLLFKILNIASDCFYDESKDQKESRNETIIKYLSRKVEFVNTYCTKSL